METLNLQVELIYSKTHLAVTEKFTIITNILNAVAQLQFTSSCKSSQRLFIYPTNKNHHNCFQNQIKSVATCDFWNHQNSKIFLNIRIVVTTTYCKFRCSESMCRSILHADTLWSANAGFPSHCDETLGMRAKQGEKCSTPEKLCWHSFKKISPSQQTLRRLAFQASYGPGAKSESWQLWLPKASWRRLELNHMPVLIAGDRSSALKRDQGLKLFDLQTLVILMRFRNCAAAASIWHFANCNY